MKTNILSLSSVYHGHSKGFPSIWRFPQYSRNSRGWKPWGICRSERGSTDGKLSYSIGPRPFWDDSHETRVVSSRSREHVRYMLLWPLGCIFASFMRTYLTKIRVILVTLPREKNGSHIFLVRTKIPRYRWGKGITQKISRNLNQLRCYAQLDLRILFRYEEYYDRNFFAK